MTAQLLLFVALVVGAWFCGMWAAQRRDEKQTRVVSGTKGDVTTLADRDPAVIVWAEATGGTP